jgi:hypothetical protein
MLKLTLPELDDFYADLVKHPNVLRVVTLSGGTAGTRPMPGWLATTA